VSARRVCAFFLLCCGLLGALPAAAAETVVRVAVVVGANQAPPGRAALRYAHEDARHVADALVAVAGFSAENVKVLLDPTPDGVLTALDRELMSASKRAEATLLFFYYSGHADDRAIFPSGQTLPFSSLKTRLEDPRAKLRVGLLDSCRGGSWTGSKGLRKVEPFEIDAARDLAEEGSVLIASSSGQENAHETEALKGSFFTHHWNAGLRGAADRGGDGIVTLGEAFEYARSLTIRDTALAGQAPQHPSFQMKLAGRRDFPLAQLFKERTTVLFEQTSGPVEFVRLSDGLVVLESPPGPRQLKLGLPSGSYLVRRRSTQGVWAKVITLSAGSTSEMGESQLVRVTLYDERRKDAAQNAATATNDWRDESWFVSAAAGVRHAPIIDPGLRAGAPDGTGVFLLRASARLARRWWLTAPLAAVFDPEASADMTYFVWAGAPVLAFAREANKGISLQGFTGAGADARYQQRARHTINANLAVLGSFVVTEGASPAPTTWTGQVGVGISETIPESVVFSLGASLTTTPLVEGRLSSAPLDSAERGTVIALGSVQRAGLRPLPLIRVLLDRAWSIDAIATAAYELAAKGWVETYLAGVTYER